MKRSTFRRRKHEKSVVSMAWDIVRSKFQFGQRSADRLAALRKPGARVAMSEAVGRSMSEQARKGARRAEAYRRTWANYHPHLTLARALNGPRHIPTFCPGDELRVSVDRDALTKRPTRRKAAAQAPAQNNYDIAAANPTKAKAPRRKAVANG